MVLQLAQTGPADVAVLVAVVPDGRAARATQAAQIGVGAVRTAHGAVGDAAQVPRVSLEGLTRPGTR